MDYYQTVLEMDQDRREDIEYQQYWEYRNFNDFPIDNLTLPPLKGMGFFWF